MRNANACIDIVAYVKPTQLPDGSWSDARWSPKISGVPVRIQWLDGNERMQFDQERYVRDAKVYMSLDTSIKAIDRVVYNDEYYDIVSIKPQGRRMVLGIKLIVDEEV